MITSNCKKWYVLEVILGLISGSLPGDQGGVTCINLFGWGLRQYFSQKCLQECKICESIEEESVIILFECQNQINQT